MRRCISRNGSSSSADRGTGRAAQPLDAPAASAAARTGRERAGGPAGVEDVEGFVSSRPSTTGASWRRIVSTSGSSGIAPSMRTSAYAAGRSRGVSTERERRARSSSVRRTARSIRAGSGRAGEVLVVERVVEAEQRRGRSARRVDLRRGRVAGRPRGRRRGARSRRGARRRRPSWRRARRRHSRPREQRGGVSGAAVAGRSGDAHKQPSSRVRPEGGASAACVSSSAATRRCPLAASAGSRAHEEGLEDDSGTRRAGLVAWTVGVGDRGERLDARGSARA